MYKVAICSDELLTGHDFHIVALKHPRSGQSAQFAFSQDYTAIYEVSAQQPEHGSWFVGSEISSDGSILYLTKFDPIFLVLPYLISQHDENPSRFSPLEQVLEDNAFPHTRKVNRCSALSCLDSVAEVKGADDYKAYRYNEQTTLQWLQKKVERLAAYLEQSNMYVSSGAQSAEFVRSNVSHAHSDDYRDYSFGIVSDYLPLPLAESLREYLGIPKQVKPTLEESSNKRVKTSSSSDGPLEDYSKGVLTEKQLSADKKLSATQKKLAKIDKTGMKSITSFFAPKPKKTS